MKIKYFTCILFLFIGKIGYSQIPIFEVNDGNKFTNTQTVIIKKTVIDVNIIGQIATVKATYTFYNPTDRILEGRATFPLPEGVSVGGYALDINGKMRSAVVVPKEKAKEVFESVKRRNVDPGILEKVEGNNFRARIYPLPAHGQRVIEIFYYQELTRYKDDNQFFVNFPKGFKIQDFELSITVNESSKVPEIIENPDGSLSFVAKGSNWSAMMNKMDFAPKQNLKINIPIESNKSQVALEKKDENESYFTVALDINLPEKSKANPTKLGLIWDNSMSGQNTDLDTAFEFLEAYFKKNPNVEIKLAFINVTLQIDQSFNIVNGQWQELKDKLLNTKYDGGTDLSKLKEFDNNQAYLFFSDGISTFGDYYTKFNKPLYAISTTPTSNFTALNQLAHLSGGKVLNLNLINSEEAIKKITTESIKFLGFEGNPNVKDVYPTIGSTVNNQLQMYGISNINQTEAVAIFGYDSSSSIRIPIKFNSESLVKNFDLKQLWAQRKIENLELNETDNFKAILELGKQYGVVTNNTSLIVLEDINDYVKYGIVPPAELLDQFNLLKNRYKKEIFEKRKNLLNKAFDATRDLKIWWNTEFTQEDKKEITKARQSYSKSNADEISSVTANEEIATGYSISDKEKEVSNGKITLVDVESNAEYMPEFNAINDSEIIYQKYLELRSKYKTNVTYYFDISKLLFKKGNKDLALKVLSSLAELDLENEELYKTIFYTLKQRGLFEKELWITKKILEWRPFDPQSHRDYALALLNNKKPQEALDVYKQLLYREFTDENALRDQGIEEILVMEMNNIISKNPTVNSSQIDNRLKADLPVDIRVVINWNKDNTDIDLWVTDPKGEDCYYSNKRSKIGGRISNDFVDGFGPEQFLLKKAISGKYKIRTNFFGERQTIKSGPTTIMAEVFLYYSDGRQERKIAVFQLEKNQKVDLDGKILIGEFSF